ncbi:MAG: hypothetical protein II630_01580 [Bacteroidales bacterium]|nr:hypothetical protein [Bacteroidales bacterium]
MVLFVFWKIFCNDTFAELAIQQHIKGGFLYFGIFEGLTGVAMRQWNIPEGIPFRIGMEADPPGRDARTGRETRGTAAHFTLTGSASALKTWTIRTSCIRSTDRRREKNLKNF